MRLCGATYLPGNPLGATGTEPLWTTLCWWRGLLCGVRQVLYYATEIRLCYPHPRLGTRRVPLQVVYDDPIYGLVVLRPGAEPCPPSPAREGITGLYDLRTEWIGHEPLPRPHTLQTWSVPGPEVVARVLHCTEVIEDPYGLGPIRTARATFRKAGDPHLAGGIRTDEEGRMAGLVIGQMDDQALLLPTALLRDLLHYYSLHIEDGTAVHHSLDLPEGSTAIEGHRLVQVEGRWHLAGQGPVTEYLRRLGLTQLLVRVTDHRGRTVTRVLERVPSTSLPVGLHQDPEQPMRLTLELCRALPLPAEYHHWDLESLAKLWVRVPPPGSKEPICLSTSPQLDECSTSPPLAETTRLLADSYT